MPKTNPPVDDATPRGRLEEGFYSAVGGELRERIRALERSRTDQMAALADATGIRNVAMLEQLVLRGVGPEALAALTLYPLIAAAWADGRVQRGERRAVLRAADECGLKPESASRELLEKWLHHAPPDEVLRDAWRAVVGELCAEMDAPQRAELRDEILARTRSVAKASGGVLGLGAVSKAERSVLETLESAFDPTG